MIHLDTHVVAWMYAGLLELIPKQARQILENEELVISPIVVLELQYLHEIGRLAVDGGTLVSTLARDIQLRQSNTGFETVIIRALVETWTRDPFDRIIVATARYEGARLLTKDAQIRKRYSSAFWQR